MDIKNKIYEIRGQFVILDSDLAIIYEVETKRINEAVKNNPLKFPERYSFKLNDEESKKFLVENFDQKKKHEVENIKIQEYLRSKVYGC